MFIIDLIVGKLTELYSYCMENKKQSIIVIVAVLLLFSVFGYFSVIIIGKLISFVFGLIFGLISFYFSNILWTLPLSALGYWYYKSK